MARTTFLDGTGDTTIEWAAEVDSQMLASIQRLMDRGYTFFVVENFHDGKVQVRRPVTDVKMLRRSIVVEEQALTELFEAGRIKLTDSPTKTEITSVKRAADPVEVATKDTVAVKKLAGG